jgi:hypothetical protein
MKVATSDLSIVFDDLVSGKRTREEVAAWANRARQASDSGTLIVEPQADEGRIWKAVLLTGVDLKISKSDYPQHDGFPRSEQR